MTTLADVQKAAAGTLFTFVDEEVPFGHFAGSALVEGDMLSVFLFEGVQDDRRAVVKGHVEYVTENGQLVCYAYAQGGLTGGNALGPVQDYSLTYAQMV